MAHATYAHSAPPRRSRLPERRLPTGIGARVDRLDRIVTGWMARRGILLARVALGLVFLWFGGLKFFSGMSPAQDLATRTIETLSLGLVKPAVSLPLLAAWEVAIGLGLITGRWLRLTLLLLFAQMAGTLLPLAFYPGETFLHAPIAPTLEGQYILKNVVLISAGVIIGATVRGGGLVGEATSDVAATADDVRCQPA